MAQQSQHPNPACFPPAAGVGMRPGGQGPGRAEWTCARPPLAAHVQQGSPSSCSDLDSEVRGGNLYLTAAPQHQHGLPAFACLEPTSRKSIEGGFRISRCPNCDTGHLDHIKVKVCVSSVEWGPPEAVARWSQLHPKRLIPGWDEDRAVAGQEWRPGGPVPMCEGWFAGWVMMRSGMWDRAE